MKMVPDQKNQLSNSVGLNQLDPDVEYFEE